MGDEFSLCSQLLRKMIYFLSNSRWHAKGMRFRMWLWPASFSFCWSFSRTSVDAFGILVCPVFHGRLCDSRTNWLQTCQHWNELDYFGKTLKFGYLSPTTKGLEKNPVEEKKLALKYLPTFLRVPSLYFHIPSKTIIKFRENRAIMQFLI